MYIQVVEILPFSLSLQPRLRYCIQQLKPAQDEVNMGTFSTKQGWIRASIYKMSQADQASQN
jgi:hypothetical protein